MTEPIFQADLEVATKAHDSIMPPREVAAEAARAHSRPASALLREVINYGTWVLVRCANSGCREDDVDLAALGFYRTVLEMADGVDASIRESAVTPAVPQLRTVFEASLQLQYVLEDLTKYRERALAWFAWHYITRLKRYERYDPTTPAGKQFALEKATDETGPWLRDMDQAQVAKGIARMHSLLGKPHVLPFKQRYDSLVAAKRTPRFWCSLSSGPANRRELAKHLRLVTVYAELYSSWSGVSHAEDLYTFFMHVPGKGGAIRPLRGSEGLLRVAGLAATFVLRSSRHMLAHFRGGEESHDRWYTEKVRPLYRAVMQMDAPEYIADGRRK